MKHLKVEYNGIVLFDGDVEEVNWSDSTNGVTVTGKVRSGGGGGGLLDILTAASRRSTEQKREELAGLAGQTPPEVIE